MKKFLVAIALCISTPALADNYLDNVSCYVYFSPNGGISTKIIEQINNAKHTIRVAAYSFTNDMISDALIKSKNRGVDVQIVADLTQSTNQYDDGEKIIAAGIPYYLDAFPGIQHNKYIIIDNYWVETGSYNYSANAEVRNGENVLICATTKGAQLYTENWNLLKSKSKRVE